MVELIGRADLLDDALVHDHHAVGQRHGLDLVVGDVDRGGAHLQMHLFDLGAHLHPELGIEVRQRLVEQEHLGVAHDGAAHGDALALAAGELLGLAVEQLRDVEDAGRLVHALLDLGLGKALEPQPERHVLEHGHVRVERVVLEHHGDVAVFGRHVVDHVAADQDLAVGDVLEPGDHPERRRLAAARWPDQHHELVVGDIEIDAANRFDLVVLLDDPAQVDFRHWDPFSPWSRRP